MKSWFTIKAAIQGSDSAEISIHDEIGVWGVSALEFIAQLKTIESPKLALSINSPGGSVIDALAIFNALRASGKSITVKVLGIAASAASYLMLAGDHVQMPANTFAMLHSPLAGAYGHADELREVADVLDKIGATLQATYVKRTGKSEEEIAALLAKDSWLTAQECLELGLCDEVLPELKVSASFDLENLPENIKAALAAPAAENGPAVQQKPTQAAACDTPTHTEQVQALALAAGLADFADVFALDASLGTIEAVHAALNDAREVRSLCAVAKQPDAASKFIRERTPLAQVRQPLIDALAAADVHIDTTPTTKETAATPAKKPGAVSVRNLWASRREQTTVRG